MTRYGLVCLLLGALMWGQAANPNSAPARPGPAMPVGAAKAPSDAAPQAAASEVPLDAPVITIGGLCPDKTTAADCKTVVTRADFEKLVEAVQPSMPARVRKQFATNYARALVMSAKAEQMGLDKQASYEEHMRLARISVLQQELNRVLQEKAGDISDKDIEDYYHANAAKFEEAEMERIYIPKNKQGTPPDPKASAAERQKLTDESEAAMKAEADKLHSRAAASDDFNKLQGEAYDAAGIKNNSPNASMGKVRRATLPPAQAAVMDLKVGEVSAVIPDLNGFFIYRIKSKDTIPLEQAREEIKGALHSQRFQDEMKAIQDAATPTFNDSYFSAASPVPGPMRPGAGAKVPGKPGASDPDD